MNSCLVLFVSMFFTTILFTSVDVSAQSSCTNVLISMSPCLNYITGNSTSPSQQCCSQLGNVVKSSPECLCQVLNGGSSQLGINVNQTQALALPKSCNVQTPPASRCNGGSSGDSPAGSTNTSGSGNGNGSKTIPTEEGSNIGNSVNFSFSLLIFFFTVSYIAIYSKY